MPANIVRPGTEEYWTRAKQQAAKQGHAEDWPYIVRIYQQMTLNKSSRNEFQKAYTPPVHPRFSNVRQANGVPDPERIEMQRLMGTTPPQFQASMLLEYGEPIMRVEAITKGLGMEPGERQTWNESLRTILQKGLPELVVRQGLFQKMQECGLDAPRRKAIFQRSMTYLHHLQKSFAVFTPDDLLKAEARGGSYYRRVQKAGGKGYRYFYSKDDYDKRDDAHVNGEDALHRRVQKLVDDRIATSGKKGVGLNEMGDLVKKFGSKVVAKCLHGAVNGGGTLFAKGRFTTQKIEKSEHRFVLPGQE